MIFRCPVFFLLALWLLVPLNMAVSQHYIRHNTVGYAPSDQKIAVIGSDQNLEGQHCFVIGPSPSENVVFRGVIGSDRGNKNTPFRHILPCDFSDVRNEGTYRIRLDDGTTSLPFSVGNVQKYEDALSLILAFYRAQRCGDTDPLLHEPCHLNDASARIDASGGWHDAGDYIKYMLTVSYTGVELLTAADYTLSFGFSESLLDRSPANGIPDVLDEVRIGLLWILNMTSDYANGNYYYQVSGEEDHQIWRLPETDDESGAVGNPRFLHAGWGGNLLGRSTAALAIASRVFIAYDPAFAERCLRRAEALFADRDNYQNVQPANPASFYDEVDWRDDMVLGAAELYLATNNPAYDEYAKMHVSRLTGNDIGWKSTDFLAYAACYRADIEPRLCRERMKAELELSNDISKRDPFFLSSEYGWGTTALFTADAQKAIMYFYLTGDETYLDMASAQRDYLLGRNNWGVSFIIGLGPVYPVNAHSQLNDLAGLHRGGVVGGPAIKSSWERVMTNKRAFPDGAVDQDRFGEFQSTVVYYDHQADYYCNEVALDYAAAAVFTLLHSISQFYKTTTPE